MMRFDIERALSYMGKDPEWGKKFFICGLLNFLVYFLFIVPPVALIVSKKYDAQGFAILVVLWVLGALLHFTVNGFVLFAANMRIKNPEALLPDWKDSLEFLFTGFKAAAGSILYFLPVMLLSGGGLFLSFIKVQANISKTALPVSYDIASASFNIAYNVIYLLFSFFAGLMTLNFIKDLNWLSFVNYKKAYNSVKGRFLSYLVLFLLIIAIAIVINLAALVLCLTIVGIIAVPFVILYTQFIGIDLIVQFGNAQETPEELK